jgi:hypothetical protein
VAEWHLTVTELPSGRLAIDGLPDGRAERQSLVYRLRDTLAAVSHADALGQSDGLLWRKYASASFRAGWLSEVTVTKGTPSKPLQ